jgi:hypothetical protein
LGREDSGDGAEHQDRSQSFHYQEDIIVGQVSFTKIRKTDGIKREFP